MFDTQQHEAFQWNEKIALISGSALLAGMMGCLGVSLGELGTRLYPNWDNAFLPWLCLGIALEAIFSEGRVRQYSFLNPGRVAYRLSEVILITFFLKIFLIMLRGDPVAEAVASWRDDFPLGFFAGEFGGLWAILMVVWAIAGYWGGLLFDLVQDTDLLRPGSEPQFFTSRKEIRRRLAGPIFLLGAVMIVITVLTRADIRLIWGTLPPVETNSLNILLYFFLAFILLSQGQFAVLRAGWIWQRIPVTRPMATGWLRYSLIFLGILALLVLILPTGYSLGLVTLTKILFSILLGIFNLLLFLLMLPIFWLLNLLARQRGQEEPFQNPLGDFFQPPPAEVVTPIATLPISEIVKSFVFWGIFLLVCGYALVQYFRQNQELLERLRRIRGLRWLVEGVTKFLDWLRGATQVVTQMAAAGWERIRTPSSKGTAFVPWGMIRPNRLSPRDQVFFYYRAFIRRAGENGLRRGVAQTPSEYAAEITRILPEAGGEFHEMSDLFIHARYTAHPVTGSEAETAKGIWEKLRTLLRAKR